MKLSIVIPVYRVEQTLDRCVESVVKQSAADLDIILVDDGSPDACPDICDQWARRDSRIRVVHKTNGGLSDARNAGLDVARGDAVAFVDSDDWVGPDTFATALAAMDADTDLVEFPVSRFHDSPHQSLLSFTPATYTDMADYWLRARAYAHAYAWNKVYRRSLFDGLRYPVGRVFEDVALLPRLLDRVRRVALVSGGCYYYCLNTQGITATATGTQLQQLLDAHLEVLTRWEDDAYYMHVLNIQLDVCELTGQPPRLHRRRVSPAAQGLTAGQRVKTLLLDTIGMNQLCLLNKTLHRWRKPRHS